MAKSATTIDQQLALLKSRGLTVNDADKAREILLDIGYYRLGFYMFPFEKSYPELRNRSHEYVEGASFEDAVNLYYFDFDLRLLLLRYLNRIEIAFRTSLIYNLSNKYNSNPVWFVSPAVVNRPYAHELSVKSILRISSAIRLSTDTIRIIPTIASLPHGRLSNL